MIDRDREKERRRKTKEQKKIRNRNIWFIEKNFFIILSVEYSDYKTYIGFTIKQVTDFFIFC